MKKRFIFFTLLLLTLIGGAKFNVLNAQETTITIGSGTNSTYYGPIYDYYTNYAITQYIYTKDEIGVSGTINSIAFRIANDLPTTRNISVYLKNTDQESYTGAYNWVLLTEEDTAVYEGSINTASKDAEGWVTIQLTTPFEYEGGNLAVTINDKTGSNGSNYSMWYTYETTASRSIYGTSYQSACDHLQLSSRYGTYYTNVGTWSNPVYAYRNAQVKFNITQASASVKVTPEFIDFGKVRIGDYWTEKGETKIPVTIKAVSTKITDISIDNDFFKLPQNIDLSANKIEFDLTCDVKNGEAKEYTATLKVAYEGSENPASVEVRATAYTPANGDVYENPITVNFDANNSFTAQATGMYDDYILPGEAEDGNLNDAVYKFTLANDGVVTANVNGTNAIAAIYKAEDLQGNGPSSDNNNTGVQNGPTGPTTFFFNFDDHGIEEFTLLDKNNDGRNWAIESNRIDKNSICSWSYIQTGSQNITPDNYFYTNDSYAITANSKLTYKVLSTWSEYYAIVIFENGVETTVQEGIIKTSGTETKEVDLSAYAGKSVQIGFRHFNCTGQYYIAIDDLALTDGSAKSRAGENQIDGIQYPAGTYYLVAAAEGDFTLNLSTASLPAPESFAYTAPENNTIVEETNPELSWKSAKYASSYDVYLGTTKVAEDITATSFQTTGLSNNTKYNWQVVAKNSIGETKGETWSFVTPLDVPQNVTASSNEIYPDNNNVTIEWDAITGVKGYNVYVKVNGEGDGIKHNGNELVTTNSYELSNMDYSLNGHVVYVTAVYEIEGETYESNSSATQTIKVTAYGEIYGTITDVANNKGIDDVTVTVTGTDEFGKAAEYTATTNGNGEYSFENVLFGTYSLTASKLDYQAITNPGVVVETNGGIEISFSLESNPSASFAVNAEEGRASWDAEYASYNVYRRDSKGNVTSLATGVKEKQYQDADWGRLAEGEYEYGVSAMMVETSYVTETFSTTSIPEGWTQNGEFEWSFNGTYAYLSQNWQSATPNNLITPLIDLSNESAPTISFKYSIGGSWTSSGYYNTLKVEVSESLNGPWTNIFTSSSYTSGFVNVEKSLSTFAGKKVYVKFVTDTDYSTTYIDDVVLPNTTSSESRINWSDPIAKKDYNTYTGTGEWDVATNWSKGIPTEESEVLINGSVTIPTDSEITVASMKINSGKSLTISNGASLTVTGLLESTYATRLVILDGGQLFQTNPEVQASFNMSIVKPEKWSENNIDGWQFIASPFKETSNNNITSFANNTYYDANWNMLQTDYDLYKYDGSQEGEEWRNHKRVTFTSFESGVGYLASQKDRESVNFIGTLNPATSFSKEFSYNDANNGDNLANFYLLGNPFTFDMDINNASFTNMVNGIAVVTSQGGYDYTQTTVPVGNGFFVQATGEATGDRASFSYTHNARSSQETANSINVIASGKAGKDNVVVNFAGQAQGFNKLQNFNDAIATVYVSENGKNYGIANVDENTTEVALNFDAKEMGSYTISLDINGEFETVTLVDRFTGVETDMLVENEYSFIASADDNVNRFVIRLGNGQEPTDNGQFVYQNGEELILSIEGSVQIVDMLGRVVYSNEHSDAYNRINVSEFNNASYVVRVVNEEGVKVQKVVIY